MIKLPPMYDWWQFILIKLFAAFVLVCIELTLEITIISRLHYGELIKLLATHFFITVCKM